MEVELKIKFTDTEDASAQAQHEEFCKKLSEHQKLYSALWEMHQYLRKVVKYEEGEHVKHVEVVKDQFWNIISEAGVSDLI